MMKILTLRCLRRLYTLYVMFLHICLYLELIKSLRVITSMRLIGHLIIAIHVRVQLLTLGRYLIRYHCSMTTLLYTYHDYH